MAVLNLAKCVHGTFLFFWIITRATSSPLGLEVYPEYDWYADHEDRSPENDHLSTAATYSAEEDDEYNVGRMAPSATSSSPNSVESGENTYNYYHVGNGTVARSPGDDGIEHEGMTGWSLDLLTPSTEAPPTTTEVQPRTTGASSTTTATPATTTAASATTEAPRITAESSTTTTEAQPTTAATEPTTTTTAPATTIEPTAALPETTTQTAQTIAAPSFSRELSPEFCAFLGRILTEIARRRNERTGSLGFGSASQVSHRPIHPYRRIILVADNNQRHRIPLNQQPPPTFPSMIWRTPIHRYHATPYQFSWPFFQQRQEQGHILQASTFPAGRAEHSLEGSRLIGISSSPIQSGRREEFPGFNAGFFNDFPNLPSIISAAALFRRHQREITDDITRMQGEKQQRR